MRHVAVLTMLLALFGAVMFVGASAQTSQQSYQGSAALMSAKTTKSYLGDRGKLVAEDNEQQKEDSEDNSNDSNDE